MRTPALPRATSNQPGLIAHHIWCILGNVVRVVAQGRYRVYVYAEQGGQHNAPHCHVEWGDGSCVIDLNTLAVLRGRPTPQARQLVRDHWGQIVAAWQRLNP